MLKLLKRIGGARGGAHQAIFHMPCRILNMDYGKRLSVRILACGLKSMRTLYLCYFGLREPLVQTQVLPYLRELVRGAVGVYLLSFEPDWPRSWSNEERRAWRERLRRDGIEWEALAYHKKPSVLATLYDILVGTLTIVRLARREAIDVLHARTHIPLVM